VSIQNLFDDREARYQAGGVGRLHASKTERCVEM
jgi:hypothetical protein